MKKLTLIFVILIASIYSVAQIAINTDGNAPNSSAALDISSTTKGVLIPRMTNTQIQSITSPSNGLLVYSLDDKKVYNFNLSDNEWKEIEYGTNTLSPYCGEILVDSRDGQSYTTIQIGTKCWMQENLNIGTMISYNVSQSNDGVIEKYCYSSNSSNCDIYGGLYQWGEMMQYITTEGAQGICPSGWHIPTDDEWKTLEMQLGMSQTEADGTGWRGTDEGGKLKETGTTHWNSPNTGATNSSSFTALPGGRRGTNSFPYFESLGIMGVCGSSSETDSGYAWARILASMTSTISRSSYFNEYGVSVRCIKD